MKDHLSGTSGEKQVKCRKRRECHMKEIRLHGRGGQGVVKASQIVVKAVVQEKNTDMLEFLSDMKL